MNVLNFMDKISFSKCNYPNNVIINVCNNKLIVL